MNKHGINPLSANELKMEKSFKEFMKVAKKEFNQEFKEWKQKINPKTNKCEFLDIFLEAVGDDLEEEVRDETLLTSKQLDGGFWKKEEP